MKRKSKILLCSSLIFAVYVPVACTDKPSDENDESAEVAPIDSSAEQNEGNQPHESKGKSAAETLNVVAVEDFNQIDQRSQLASFELEKSELWHMAKNNEGTKEVYDEKLRAAEKEQRTMNFVVEEGRKSFVRMHDQMGKISDKIENYRSKQKADLDELGKISQKMSKLEGRINELEGILNRGFPLFGGIKKEFQKELSNLSGELNLERNRHMQLRDRIRGADQAIQNMNLQVRELKISLDRVNVDTEKSTMRLNEVLLEIQTQRVLVDKLQASGLNIKRKIENVERKIVLNRTGSLVDDQTLSGLPGLMVSAPFQYQNTNCKVIFALRSSGRSFSRVRFCDNGSYQIDRGVLKLEHTRNAQTDFTRDTYPFKVKESQCVSTEASMPLYVFKQTPANQAVSTVTVSEKMNQNPVVLTDAKEIASFGSAISCGDLLKKDRTSLENDLVKYAVKACDISLKDNG
ncbi:MAG: hypothetical protein NT027_13115 [Proteobacteria bacterium]|nr:hypothetical protein [Pseudomonadota bacterium]